jgi:hypothetical protein
MEGEALPLASTRTNGLGRGGRAHARAERVAERLRVTPSAEPRIVGFGAHDEGIFTERPVALVELGTADARLFGDFDHELVRGGRGLCARCGCQFRVLVQVLSTSIILLPRAEAWVPIRSTSLSNERTR